MFEAFDEYISEGPEYDDEWPQRAVLELVENFGTFLNVGAEAGTWGI